MTEHGGEVLRSLRDAARAQQQKVLGPLDPDDREQLAKILGTLADAHGLDREVHLGYRSAKAPDA
jgi:DNA-binding MarR family transcriptional regulator